MLSLIWLLGREVVKEGKKKRIGTSGSARLKPFFFHCGNTYQKPRSLKTASMRDSLFHPNCQLHV